MSQDHNASISVGGQQPCQDLLSLPEAVLGQIAHLCHNRNQGHPMLGLSRGGRDTVLSNLKKIRLLPSSYSAQGAGGTGPQATSIEQEAMGRLLNRACSQAPAGLEVSINLGGRHRNDANYLSKLLQPGTRCGGWHHVQLLEIIHGGADVCLHLIPQAFPALHYLRLHYVHLGDGALFDMIGMSGSPTLSSLVLDSCTINDSALERAAAALSRLHSLQSLQFHQPDTMMRLVAQVTGLTSLLVDHRTPSADEQPVMVAAHNTQLQKLVMIRSHWGPRILSADHLQHILVSCTGLTELELHRRQVDQGGLDTLLKHGTRITHLTLSSTPLTASRAHVPCNWKVLRLSEPSLRQLAYLPLTSVQELTACWGSCADTLHLPLDHAPQLPSLLSQAATNLAACPACTKQPPQGVVLSGTLLALTSQQRVQLFEALAPLRAMQLEHLCIFISMELGAPEAEALAHSLGDSITSLELDGCTLHSSFWRPLAQQFPKLQHLTLHSNVRSSADDLSRFSITRSQSRPDSLTITIHRLVLGTVGMIDLEARMAASQLQHIRLVPV